MSFFFGGRSSAAAPKKSPEPTQHFMSGNGAAGAHSLELVRYNQDTGKFEVGDEALAMLKATKGPIGVVAVAGRARQGKSYILNQLLGRSGGFVVGPTHRPCTKGLWMWSAPVERTSANGSKYSLVLLDTEGIDAYDQTGQYSTQIFSLAVLLSSLFVYNQMGGIDEAALDRLSLVTEMTKHIRVRASDGAAEDPSELAAFTPSFVWLLRDFYLRLEEDGMAVTPRDYLESALQTLPGGGAGVGAKNQIRQSIKALFPDRDCFTLVRPVNEEDALARLDSLPTSQLRPEFKEGLSRFAQLVFAKALPKRLGTQVLTGPLLAGLTEAYVTAINSGAVPTIATAWQGVAEAESRRAADAAEAAYHAAFPADSVPAEDAALEAAHATAMAAAQREFDAVALGDASVKDANDKRWRQVCASKFKELREKKLATAELACERAINEGTARLQAVARREGATLDDLQREAAAFQQQYSAAKEISGPAKWRRLADFMRDVYGHAQADMSHRQAERQRAEAASVAQAAAAAQSEAQQATRRASAAEASTAALQARVADLERQLAKANADLAAERQAAAATAAQLAELRQGAHGRDSERSALVSRVTELQQSEAQLRTQVGALQQQLAAVAAEGEGTRQAAARATAEAQGWDAERARLQATLSTVTSARDAALADKAVAEQTAANAAAEAAGLRSQLAAAQAAAARAPPPSGPTAPQIPVSWPPPNEAATEDADMGGLEINVPEEEAGPSGSAPPAARRLSSASLPDTKKMTVNAMKEWLMANGHEAKVWDLSQKKAKKKDFEDFIKSLGA